GLIDIPKWDIQDVPGLHQPMWTIEQYNELKALVHGQSPKRYTRKKHNPEFPLANLLKTADCQTTSTVSGSFHRNGKPNDKGRPEYCCRVCRTIYKRAEVHQELSRHLNH